jgi:hypothetical protein
MRFRPRTALILSLLLLLLLIATSRDSLHPADYFQYCTDPYTGAYRFDWNVYELQTILEKISGQILGIDQLGDMDEETQVAVVRQYFSLVKGIGRLESEIAIERATEGEEADTATLQAEWADLRERRQESENLVENIIRLQVESTLLSQGISLELPFFRSSVLPPVEFEFQSSPDFLIVSRRDRIERIGTVSLQPGLSLSKIEEIEGLTDELGVSSLVVPTGGVGAYPTVIVENTTLEFTIRVVIHEWTHNYLYFHPLGQHYADSQELTTMNETVASMVEDELSLELARRYYPDIYERRLEAIDREQSAGTSSYHEDEFSLNANMRKTRLRAEALLQAGAVEEAEQYMEERRQKLVEMGYYVRKLNQAYFAFYGSYAAGKGWAAETSPIGQKLRELREASPSLANFLRTVASLTSYEELVAELEKG